MAAMATASTVTTTLTPPSSSHGNQHSWGYSDSQNETLTYDKNTTSSFDRASRVTHSSHNGVASCHSEMDAVRDSRTGRDLDDHSSGADRSGDSDEDSKWIHRDKLARIENEELQAAGIFIPRPRATSKQRRDRSRSAMRRGTDASEQGSHHTRSRKNSAAVDPPSWDLRTPEEIAEEEANAYFGANSIKGGNGSRIPVKKTAPAPISVDHPDRSSARNKSESPDEDAASQHKSRSRSASIKMLDSNGPSGNLQPAKKSATDVSPKKNPTGARKTPTAKSGTTTRPKTRSGMNRESNGTTRPTTRSGELSPGNNKAPEGDPPWMINSYKPDPRLPPDQQLLPTVARRLQQEQWEREGKFGDVYDKEFRPLNDNTFLRPPEPEAGAEPEKSQEDGEAQSQQQGDEWPLRADAAKSPTQRQGSYSTMPKISDKPQVSPIASPRTPATHHVPNLEQPAAKPETQAPERVPQEPEDDGKKGGCGCCVVM